MKELVKQLDSVARDVEKLKSLQDSGASSGVTSVTASSPLASSGGTTPNLTLGNSGVTPGSYTNAAFTVDIHGLVSAASSGSAPVTAVTGSAPVTSSGGATPAIGIAITTTNDGGAIAKQASYPGTAQTGNAHVNGTLGADTQVQSPLIIPSTAVKGLSSNYPTVGTTTLAEKMGNVYLANSKDVYPDNDQYGLWDRLVNYGYVPDEHFGQGADELAWTGYAAYTGFVTPVFQIYGKSMLQLAHNAAASSFRYRAASTGANIFLRCRVGITYVVSAGLMIDDGVNNADGNGANNFYRVYLTQGALAGAWTAVEQYRTGGGAVTTNVGPTMPYGPFAGIQLTASGTRWTSWTGAPSTFGENGQSVQFTGGSVAFSWTPVRVGLYAKFSAVDGGRRAVFDWYDEATS